MVSGGQVEKQIANAIASGKLAATGGVGKPIANLDADPLWWAKSLLKRQKTSDGFGDARIAQESRLRSAIEAELLSDARRTLRDVNSFSAEWNAGSDAEHHLPIRSETWLLTQRAPC